MTYPIKRIAGLCLYTLVAGVVLSGCGEPGAGSHTVQASSDLADTSTATLLNPLLGQPPALFARATGQAYTLYLKIGDALVRGDRDAAAHVAGELLVLPPVGDSSAAADTQAQLYASYVRAIEKAAANISKGDIKQQRAAFGVLSGDMFELIKFFGNDKPVYQVHCPMAFDDHGGSWLSDRAVVRNPYYGNDMLECGEIVAIIRH